MKCTDKETKTKMLASLRKLHDILTPRDRRNAALLLLLLIIGAALEVVSIAAVPAFVSAVVDPDRLASVPVLGNLVIGTGLTGTGMVLWGALAVIGIFGLKNAFLILNHYVQLRYVTNRRVSLASRLMKAYMRAPYSFHLTHNTSELLRNVDREVTVICYQVIASLLDLCTRLVILLAVFAFLFAAEPLITLYWVVFLGAVAAFGVIAISGRMRRYGLEEQAQRSRFVQALYQGFGCIKEARVLNRDAYFTERVDSAVRKMAIVNRFKQFIGRIITPISEFVAIAGLLALASALVLLGRPTESILVTLSLFVVGLVRLREVTSAAMTHFAHLRYSLVSIDPVYDDLVALGDGRPDAQADRARAQPLKIQKSLEVKDVWFRHAGAEKPSLEGVSMTVPAGSAVGFVGSTGAGKSTAVDMILGLIEPDRGSVLVDGVDIRERGLASWQKSIGYVPQSIYLLDDTIRRNIALGVEDDEIDEVALAEAVRVAQLEKFVDRQPSGLDTEIGEQGIRLSGGERQRIGIARALYHRPSVLIFDEATSALDNTTERSIIGAVERLRGEHTIIMIAHRLTTVRNCDRLYFLKDGRVEAEGDYNELERANSDFRMMASA